MYDPFAVDRLIDTWLMEDIGYCDLTAQTMIDASDVGAFVMNARGYLEELLTPEWVRRDNGCVYVTLSRAARGAG